MKITCNAREGCGEWDIWSLKPLNASEPEVAETIIEVTETNDKSKKKVKECYASRSGNCQVPGSIDSIDVNIIIRKNYIKAEPPRCMGGEWNLKYAKLEFVGLLDGCVSKDREIVKKKRKGSPVWLTVLGVLAILLLLTMFIFWKWFKCFRHEQIERRKSEAAQGSALGPNAGEKTAISKNIRKPTTKGGLKVSPAFSDHKLVLPV